MAITMQGATIESSARTTFKAAEITPFENPFPNVSGRAGITADFASAVSTEIESLKTNIKSKLDEMTSESSDTAIKGTEVTNAIKNFIDGVILVANSYNDALTAAENEIVNKVSEAYTKQDENLASDLNTDKGTLEQSKLSVSSDSGSHA